MAGYAYILFDLDGTLTDPGEGITRSVAYALRHFGIEVTDRTTLYPFIGPPLRESFQRYYGFSDEQTTQAVGWFREYFETVGLFENTVYPGVPEMLAALTAAGKRLVLATSKPEAFARQILEHFSLASYFAYIAGANMDETRTRKAEVVAYALKSVGITDLSRAVMVGDREYDVRGAREAGLATVGVLYGYGSRAELEQAGAIATAASVEQLQAILLAE